jgi:hypothetical protein
MLLEYKEYKPVGISAKYKYLNHQHSVGKVVLKYNKYTIFNRFLTPSIKLLSTTNLENMPPPPSEIWPPRKHSLLYRYKLGNREASSKTKILKVFVSIYSWFA